MFIAATGMICSVGLSAAAACAAMRANVAGFAELPYLDNDGRPIIGAAVRELDPDLKRGPRLLAMLALALTDCLGKRPGQTWDRIPLLLGLSEPGRPGGVAEADAPLLKQLQDSLKTRFHPTLSRTIRQGHVAGFEGLRLARDLLRGGTVGACLVAGVDSYVNARSLLWLDKEIRLKTEENSNGVIPGEAAAVVLVQHAAPPASAVSVEVLGLGFAKEKATVLADEPLIGLGLTAAVRAALAEAKVALHELDFRLSDVTGESYGFKEQVLMIARLMRASRETFPLWHCGDSIGDTGAAAGVCALVRAFEAFAKGYAPGERALGCCSSVPGERAAVVLQRRKPGERR